MASRIIIGGDDSERETIFGALKQANGDRSAAAKLLDVSRSTLHRRLRAIDPDGAGLAEVARIENWPTRRGSRVWSERLGTAEEEG